MDVMVLVALAAVLGAVIGVTVTSFCYERYERKARLPPPTDSVQGVFELPVRFRELLRKKPSIPPAPMDSDDDEPTPPGTVP
jgi:hypothetical protein